MLRILVKLLPALLVCCSLAATGVFHTWQRVEGVLLGYRLDELVSEHDRLVEEKRSLVLEMSTLRQHSRIELMARNELGMVPPRPSQVTVVSEPFEIADGSEHPTEKDLSMPAQSEERRHSSLVSMSTAEEGPRG